MQKLIMYLKKICAKRKEEKTDYHNIPDDISIISCSCLGGCLYHRYKQKFLSPTINLFMDTPDFIKFCLNLETYLKCDLKYVGMRDEFNYPIALLDDIRVYFVHYKNFEEAKRSWNERKNRINFDNIYVICSDRDFYYDDLLTEFNKISYKKVLFSHKKIENEDVVYVEMDKNRNSVGLLTELLDFCGTRRADKYFDFEKWFSGKFTTKECRRF